MKLILLLLITLIPIFGDSQDDPCYCFCHAYSFTSEKMVISDVVKTDDLFGSCSNSAGVKTQFMDDLDSKGYDSFWVERGGLTCRCYDSNNKTGNERREWLSDFRSDYPELKVYYESFTYYSKD